VVATEKTDYIRANHRTLLCFLLRTAYNKFIALLFSSTR
jgi:hypothetical protein